MASKGKGRRGRIQVTRTVRKLEINTSMHANRATRATREILDEFAENNRAMREAVMHASVGDDPVEINLSPELKLRVDVNGIRLTFRDEQILILQDPEKAAAIADVFSAWIWAFVSSTIMHDMIGCKCEDPHMIHKEYSEDQ